LRDALKKRSEEISPEFAEQYSNALKFHKEVTAPARNLRSITKEHIRLPNYTANKKEMANALEKAISEGSQEHFPFSKEDLKLADRLIRGIPAYRNLVIGTGLVGGSQTINHYLRNLLEHNSLMQPMLEQSK
jgi:hypothetical protein